MARRQSIANEYPNRPGTRILPPSYQPEPISMNTKSMQPFQPLPMTAQPRTPSVMYNNSFKNNRVAPPPPRPMNYNSYSQPHRSLETPSSMISTNPLIRASHKQRAMDTRYPNQTFYQQNNYIGSQPDENFGENTKPISWFSKPLCLGLTRLTGGVLFGTMIFLSVASIGGLITSVVLYIQDITTDPQWKILGMVVCAIMLLTVLVTLCIFLYCYKKGRINNHNNNNNNNMNSLTPPYQQETDFRHPYNYNRSPMPYGRMESVSPTSINEGIIQVQDKLTNTEATISPLRPRDIHRGVWQGTNAYGGLSYRPIEPPKMAHRSIQVLPNEVDQIPSKQRNPIIDNAPQTMIRLPGNRREYATEKHPRRFLEPQPPHGITQQIITKPRRRSSDEYVEIVELPKKGRNKQRFNKVSVKHVKTNPEPEFVEEDFNTDHFYQ